MRQKTPPVYTRGASMPLYPRGRSVSSCYTCLYTPSIPTFEELLLIVVCWITGIPFEATTEAETTHPQLRPLLKTAFQIQIYRIVMKRLRIARKWGVSDIGVFVTFARTGDAAYLAAKLNGEDSSHE
jgi:hypothetical protein